MAIPEFPTFRPLLLVDKLPLDAGFAVQQPELSQYTFTNIFAWRKARNMQVSQLEGMTLLMQELPGRRVYLEPMGEGHVREVIVKCLAEGGFAYLSWNTVAVFQGEPGYVIEQDRDNSDYLYLTSDLAELAGRKYDAKRNFIKRFQSEHEYRYLPLTADITRECRKFEEHWCEDRSCQSDEGLSHEMEAVTEMLDNFGALGYRGGALEVDGAIAAFSLGEKLNDETFVVHVEKADAKLTGIYAVINNEFCRHGAAGFKYVNREQDLGIPGLRQAKLTYHPARMIDCYRLRRSEQIHAKD